MNPALATAVTIIASFAASVAATWLVRGWLEGRRVLGGRLDDTRHIDGLHKLALQVAVAVAFLAAAGPFSRLELFGLGVDAAWLNIVVSLLWIVGFVNIYNFMDGIDGLAGGYGAVCACVLGVWLVLAGAGGLALFMYGLMAACLGFLVFNWAPPRLFLRDAARKILFGTLAAVAIIAQREHGMPVGAFILLFAVFIGDTAYTLVRRALRGAPVWQAHKEHLYQRAVQSGLSHASVTGKILLISVIIAIPASLEMGRVDPRALWPVVCAFVLWAVMIRVRQRENRTQ